MTGLLDDFEPPTPTPFEVWWSRHKGDPMFEGQSEWAAMATWEAALASRRQTKAHSNGHAAEGFKSVCSSCGNEYASVHRPKPGRRNYCTDCRAAGEPAADRQRDYRDRRRQEVQS